MEPMTDGSLRTAAAARFEHGVCIEFGTECGCGQSGSSWKSAGNDFCRLAVAGQIKDILHRMASGSEHFCTRVVFCLLGFLKLTTGFVL
jgi:hypothetical protein